MTTYDEVENTVIETIDDNGDVVKFELLDVIEVEEQEYGILFPLDENGEYDEDEESEAFAMRLMKEGDGYYFERIEDDAEFQRVADYIDSLKDEV